MNNKLTIISLSLFAAFATSVEAAPAGKVIMATGETVALRAGQEVRLVRDSEIEIGDTIRVGDRSNMQVRFADEALMSLRANSMLKIDNYRFANKPAEDSAVLSLIKGGVRTVTGLIGRISRADYVFKAPTATIGIRGTHFALRHCENDCLDNGGEAPANGLYGGVTDGRIAVTNDAGEREYGQQDYFYVASANELPRLLLAPPSFLRDKLDGQARSKGNKPPAETVDNAVLAESVVASAVTTVAGQPIEAVTIPLAAPGVSESVYSPAEQIYSTETPGTYTVAFLQSETGTGTVTSCFSGCTTPSTSSFTSSFTIASDDQVPNSVPQSALVDLVVLGGTITEHTVLNGTDSDGSTFSDDRTDTSVTQPAVELGADASAGNLRWARYLETSSGSFTSSFSGTFGTSTNTSSETSTDWVHEMMGDPATALPTSGIFTYNHIGSTTPTDQNGATGAWLSHGQLSVDFTGKTMSTASPIEFSGPSAAVYTLSFTNEPVRTEIVNSFPGTITGTSSGTVSINGGATYSFNTPVTQSSSSGVQYQSILPNATCSGGGCTSVNTAEISPQFFGASGQGLGLAITTSAITTNGTEGMAAVKAYKQQ